MNKNEKKIKETVKTVPKCPPKSAIREYFQSFVVTLVMALFGMTFMVQAVTVPTGSMQNTINIGDYLLVNKFIFAPGGRPLPFLPQREIKRGALLYLNIREIKFILNMTGSVSRQLFPIK